MNEQKKLAQVREEMINTTESELMIDDNPMVFEHSAYGGRKLFKLEEDGDKVVLSRETRYEKESHEVKLIKGADGKETVQKTVTITSLT